MYKIRGVASEQSLLGVGMDVSEELKKVIKGEVQKDEKTLKKYSEDASLFKIKPRVVVFPRDVEDIKAIVRFVAENKKNDPTLSMTVRSGGTDMTGGTLTESIVVDVNRHLNQLKEVGDTYAVVEPGMWYRDFEKETLKHDLFMPSYPASRELCTVGGMVANNAGGEKTLTYGKTEDYVDRVKMILRDGNEYEFKALNKEQLDEKIKLNDVEGEVYKKLFEMLDKNYDVIKNAKPRVSKNSAGYFLWNVWDKEKKVFDIPKLITGSQGTFGIITEITFDLVDAAIGIERPTVNLYVNGNHVVVDGFAVTITGYAQTFFTKITDNLYQFRFIKDDPFDLYETVSISGEAEDSETPVNSGSYFYTFRTWDLDDINAT